MSPLTAVEASLTLFRNLDAVELQCAGLVSLIQRLDPEVDIESLLETILRNPDQNFQISAERSRNLNLDLGHTTVSDKTEWNESSLVPTSQIQDVPLDGMATLPSRRAESGYLGRST
jgi:transcriptional regulatory protein GAL4